jgi:hypothetical protein
MGYTWSDWTGLGYYIIHEYLFVIFTIISLLLLHNELERFSCLTSKPFKFAKLF